MHQAEVLFQKDWLTVNLGNPHSVVSWAIVGGGVGVRNAVVWHQVKDTDLTEEVDPVQFFRSRMSQRGLTEDAATGFLTSTYLGNFSQHIARQGQDWVRCIATVGLGNGVRVAARPKRPFLSKVGTINLLVQTSKVLTLSASFEAMSIAAEARTLAILEAKVAAFDGSGLATGTGTDCIGVASPLSSPLGSPSEGAEIYSGKHTVLGQLIGRSVYDAVSEGAQKWKAQRNLRQQNVS